MSFTLEVNILVDETKMFWDQLDSLWVDMEENWEDVHRMKHSISSVGALLQSHEFKHASNALLMANVKLRVHECLRNLDLSPSKAIAIVEWYFEWFLPTMKRHGTNLRELYYARCKIQALWQEIWPTAEGGMTLEIRVPVDVNYCIKPDSVSNRNNETAQIK